VVPVDGRVEERATLDESVVTGESQLAERAADATVASGAVNAGAAFGMRATTTAGESTYAGIVRLAREATAHQAPTVDRDATPPSDRDTVHDSVRRRRANADTNHRDRVFLAEAVVSTPQRLAQYLRPDEMHTAFNFPYLKGPWEAGPLREASR
jgi:hypothetical protein